jgi:hypothetical protein
VIAGVLLLLLSAPCLLSPLFTLSPEEAEKQREATGAWRQRKAYEKFQRGEEMTELDVHDLANRPLPGDASVKPVVICGLILFVLGAGVMNLSSLAPV